MSWFHYDPDEWETVFTSQTHGTYPGTNVPFGSAGISQRPRSPEEIANIKAVKARAAEDEILRRAGEIARSRAANLAT